MATLSNAARTAACLAIVQLIDAGSPPGNFILTTVSGGTGTTLSTITLANPAFTNPPVNGVATLAGVPRTDSSADNTGTAAGWALRNAANTVVISGSIGTGSEDLDIDNASIVSGQTVNLNAITVTVPAS